MSKRILFCLTVGLIITISLSARTQHEEDRSTVCDSTYIFYYPSCIQMFKTDYKNNRQTLQQFKKRLQSFTKGKDTLYVNGYSGECYNDFRNLRTAFRRSNNLKGYLINYFGLRERDFKTVNIPYNHPDLGDIVLVSFSPSALPVRTEEAALQAEAALHEEPEKEEVTETNIPAEQPQPEQPQQPAEQRQPQQQPAEPLSQQAVEAVSEQLPSAGRYVALKTNLAAWAGTILNIAVDVQVNEHLSVELPILWCPWHISSKHAVKTFTIQPEARYWLSKPGKGHFFGVHAHIGWFNVKWNRDRYQDIDRPLLGAGISYGYLLPFNEHWAGEFTLGAGYANMRYDTYYNMDNGARIDTRTKNYWGITRVGLSVVYRFNLRK